MRPVGIFRHAPTEGPGSFATYLDRHDIDHSLVRIDAGEPVPTDPSAFSGLAFMGGPMSVNDDLPWIAAELALIRAAVRANVPVIGHCLGGQLLAKALGGTVARNPAWEIGWLPIRVATERPHAPEWFGPIASFVGFHWHGETFTNPPGAVPLASSALCANQVFVLGPHIGMQCHVEMTVELIRTWIRGGVDDMTRNTGPGVQSAGEIEDDIEARVAELGAVAERIYDRWVAGLRR